MIFEDTLNKLFNSEDLSFKEAECAMRSIMSGEVSEIALSAWLTAMKIKGETADEVGGCASEMNRHSYSVQCTDSTVVDIVGTGGDGAKSFNISTASAFVAAGGGITVAKHGNRAVSSRSGAADVLSELGVNIMLTPEEMSECLNEVGMAFLFAPNLHPAMKYAMPVRRELQTRTIFNILGPLCNPVHPRRITVGVYNEDLCRLVAGALIKIGITHAMVVHGRDGMDEISITAPTKICEVRNGEVTERDFNPVTYGIALGDPVEIQGGTPAENAEIIEKILYAKEMGAPRRIVLLNAASSFIVSGRAGNWKDALEMVAESIDSGKAAEKLDLLRSFSNSRT